MAKSLIEKYDIISKEAIDTQLKSVSLLDDLYSKMQKVIGESSKFGKTFGDPKNIQDLDEAQKQYQKTVEQTNKIMSEAVDVSEKQRKADLELAKAKEEKRRYSKEVTEQAKQEVAEQKNEIGTIEKLRQRNKELTEQKKALNLETKEGQKVLKEINKEQDENNKALEKYSNTLEKQKIGIGDYSKAWGGLTKPLQAVKKGFDLLMAHPIIATIALITSAFMLLVKMFKNTDDAGTKMEAMFEGLKNVFELLKNQIIQFVKSTGARLELFSLGFKKMWATITRDSDAIKELEEKMADLRAEIEEGTKGWDSYKDAFKAGADAIKMMDELQTRMIAGTSEMKRLNTEVAEYLNYSRDTSLSERERLNYLLEAEKRSKEYYGRLRGYAQDEFDAEIKRYASRTRLSEQELKDFIAMDEEKQVQLQNSNARYGEAADLFNKEVMQKLEDLYSKAYDADKSYYAETRKMVAQISSLRKSIIEAGKKESEEMQEELKQMNTIPKVVENANDIIYKSLISKNQDYIQNVKKGLVDVNSSFETQMMAFIEELRKSKREEDLIFAESLMNQIIAHAKYIDEKEKKERKAQEEAETLEREKHALKQQLYQESLNLANTLFGAEIELTTRKYDDEILMAQKAGKDTTKIEQDKARQIAEIQRKQAIMNKSIALTEIAWNTAKAVMRILAEVPKVDFGIMTAILTAGAIATGAMQTASVLAQPLPQIPKFFVGTENAPSTFIAGDAPLGTSTEIVKHPTKGTFLVNKPTLFTGFEGAEVIPEKMIKQDLSEFGKRYKFLKSQEINKDFDLWGGKIVDAIVNKKETIIHLDNNAIAIMENVGRNKIRYINRKFNRK